MKYQCFSIENIDVLWFLIHFNEHTMSFFQHQWKLNDSQYNPMKYQWLSIKINANIYASWYSSMNYICVSTNFNDLAMILNTNQQANDDFLQKSINKHNESKYNSMTYQCF